MVTMIMATMVVVGESLRKLVPVGVLLVAL